MNDETYYEVEGEVVGWLSHSTDGGVGRETMIVSVTRCDGTVTARGWFQLRWVGNDYRLVKRNESPAEMADEVEIGDTVIFSTNTREQLNYAVA